MKKTKDRHSKSGGQGQGMNWIRPAKRLAIYLRDGLACVYCDDCIESGAKLTLDHVVPHSEGGSNKETNLVTCCHRCNSSRGNRSLSVFAKAAAGYLNHGLTARTILYHVATTVARPLDILAAKELISRRGGFVAACKTI